MVLHFLQAHVVRAQETLDQLLQKQHLAQAAFTAADINLMQVWFDVLN